MTGQPIFKCVNTIQMKYNESIRNQTSCRGRKDLRTKKKPYTAGYSRIQGRTAVKGNSRRKAGQSKSQFADISCSLLSESFIGSVDHFIRQIEDCKTVPLVIGINDKYKSSFNTCVDLLEKIDLPGFDDVEIGNLDKDFRSSLERALNRFLGCDDICVIGDDITIASLRNEEDCGYFPMTYEDVDRIYFQQGCGILFILFFALFKKFSMIPDLGGYDTDTYIEMEMYALDGEDDPVRIEEINLMAKSYRSSEDRFNALRSLIGHDINFDKIVDILRTYDVKNGVLEGFKSGNEFLAEIADLLVETKEFFEMIDRTLPIIEEYNFMEMLVWFGSDAEWNYNQYSYNENVGQGEGFYIRYKGIAGSYEYPKVDAETIAMWNEARIAGIPNKPIMETYSEILKKLFDEKFIAKFAGVHDKGDICSLLYRELAGTGRGSESRYQKWKSIGDASSFSQLFIRAYRDGFRNTKDRPSGNTQSLTA
jgi:hypothetical protein